MRTSSCPGDVVIVLLLNSFEVLTVISLCLLCLMVDGHLLNGFNGIDYRCYADDAELCFSAKPNNLRSLTYLSECFSAITN